MLFITDDEVMKSKSMNNILRVYFTFIIFDSIHIKPATKTQNP